MGASLDTGNLGVNALLASTVKCILHAHPEAKISLLEGRRVETQDVVKLSNGPNVYLDRVGVRFNKTFWRQNNVFRILFTSLLLRLIPSTKWKRKLVDRNSYLKTIVSAELVGDITGGDSFSDIYGMRRFFMGCLQKIMILATGAPLVLLPQTYGPFKHYYTRLIARYILFHAKLIYSRDQEGLDELKRILGKRRRQEVQQMCPDVAFVLDPIAPNRTEILPDSNFQDTTLIGINVSGLLYHGGYTGNNMFGLKIDYATLVDHVIESILKEEQTKILLVPHVFPHDELAFESDPVACQKVLRKFQSKYPDRLYYVEGKYDQSEIKHIIGLCDFFIGSRMHSCIAAISQGIPTVPLAYSRKFRGVFETIGFKDLVINLTNTDYDEVVSSILHRYRSRCALKKQILDIMPSVKARILSQLFHSI